MVLTRLDNPKIKRVKQLLAGRKHRQDAFVVESLKLIRDYVETCPEAVELVLAESGREGLNDLEARVPVQWVSTAIMKSLSRVKTAQGYVAVIQKPKWVYPEPETQWSQAVILDGIQDPSNCGAILRCCVAFGVDLVLVCPTTVDVFHPDSVRTASVPLMGLSMGQWNEGWQKKLKQEGAQVFALDPQAKPSIFDIDPAAGRGCFVLGSEGKGLLSGWGEGDNDNVQRIRIPTELAVESLNVSVSAGIALATFNKTRLRAL